MNGHDGERHLLQLEAALARMLALVAEEPHQGFTMPQLEHWAGDLSLVDFFNLTGLLIARRYSAGALDWESGDLVINNLFSACWAGDPIPGLPPQPFFSIFQAFDAGEYYRTPDCSDDPISDWTDPQIAAILAKIDGG